MIFAFYTPFFAETGWAGLPEPGEHKLWTSAGEAPGGGVGVIAGMLAGMVYALGANRPSVVFVAPDDGSGADFLREYFRFPETVWSSASEAEAQAALDEMVAAGDPAMRWIIEDHRPAVRKAAALAWRELRRIS